MAGAVINDLDVTLLKAGVPVGDNKANATGWAGVLTVSYGGAADTWNAGLTAADVNNANFGVQISAQSTGAASAQIDYIQITVTYTVNSVKSSLTMTGAGK